MNKSEKFWDKTANNYDRVEKKDERTYIKIIAKNKADGRKIGNIYFAHSTIFDERFKRGSFDVILVFNILHLLKDPHKGMQRINELLKTGGLIISATPCMGEKKILSILLSLVTRLSHLQL